MIMGFHFTNPWVTRHSRISEMDSIMTITPQEIGERNRTIVEGMDPLDAHQQKNGPTKDQVVKEVNPTKE
jgi:hypothetical protein